MTGRAGAARPDYRGAENVEAVIREPAQWAREGPHPPAPSPVAEQRATGEGERPSPSPVAGATGEGRGGGLTIPQLLELVERAARGDAQLGAQLFPAMEQLSRDPSAPPELRALGRVLLNVLAGDLSPNLDDLPNDLASLVRGMLGRLRSA